MLQADPQATEYPIAGLDRNAVLGDDDVLCGYDLREIIKFVGS